MAEKIRPQNVERNAGNALDIVNAGEWNLVPLVDGLGSDAKGLSQLRC